MDRQEYIESVNSRILDICKPPSKMVDGKEVPVTNELNIEAIHIKLYCESINYDKEICELIFLSPSVRRSITEASIAQTIYQARGNHGNIKERIDKDRGKEGTTS